MTRSVLPTERSLLQGLVIARWASWLWMAGLVVMAWRAEPGSSDRLDHPGAAVSVLTVVAVVNIAFSASVRNRPTRVLDPRFAALELVLAWSLYVADGWVFVDGHVFDSSLALHASWPLVAVLSTAIVHGPIVGAVAGVLVPTGRIVGAVVNGASIGDGDRVLSFASSIVFYAIAGVVIGLIAHRLRDVESEVERRRARDEVARQLHDGVLQTLALVGRRCATTDPELAEVARRSDLELRAWLTSSTAPSHGDADLEQAVRTAVHRAAAPFGLAVSIAVVADEQPSVAAAVADAIAGAIGEAVTNVGKHARVRQAVVFVEVDDDGQVFASVRDEGDGIAPTARHGTGITRSIEGRMHDIGGRMAIVSTPGAGTEVQLWSR